MEALKIGIDRIYKEETMPTDNERKQVAQRLRRIEERGATIEEYRWYLQLVKHRSLLASLIDPEPEKTCEDVSTE